MIAGERSDIEQYNKKISYYLANENVLKISSTNLLYRVLKKKKKPGCSLFDTVIIECKRLSFLLVYKKEFGKQFSRYLFQFQNSSQSGKIVAFLI